MTKEYDEEPIKDLKHLLNLYLIDIDHIKKELIRIRKLIADSKV